MGSLVNEKLINFRVYQEGGSEVIGIATVDLPELTAITSEVSGAGILGKLETPTMGQYDSMKLTLNFRTITTTLAGLTAPTGQAIECRGSIQTMNPNDGSYSTVAVRIVGRGNPTSTKFGKLEVSSMMDASLELELNYFLLQIGGSNFIEVDKYNFVCNIAGDDILSSIRQDLGLMGRLSASANSLFSAISSKIGI